ncbi:MAG TPA: redoxin domain-containing protein [Blastocatellia bacterium]
MKSWLLIFGLFVAFCFCASETFAQVSRLEPEQPRWGQTLTITYDAAAPGAKFSAEDQIYIAAKLTFPDHSENISARMVKVEKRHRFELKVKENSASIAIHFITMSGGWDEQAYATSIVFRADGQPARGALASKIPSGRYQEYFKQETTLYPDNYSAYRAKWLTASLVESEKAGGIINADLKRLSRKDETAELLSALSIGYLLIGREDKSRELIRQLVSRFPDSPFTGQAIGDYEEQIANQHLELAGADGRAEVSRLKLEVIKANSAAEFARNASLTLARDQRAPLDVIEKVAETWRKAEPENPQSYFNLALACLTQYRKYEIAALMIEKAIELLLAGKLRLHGDINGKQTEAMLPEVYLMSADLAFRQQRFGDAFAAVDSAKAFGRENDFGPFLLEAKILQAVGKNTYAETAFLEAWRRSSQEAEERLKTVYKGRRGSLDGFDEYLLGATKNKTATEKGFKQAAPSVRLASLDGTHFELNALGGKIVVLNLWFIGCSPCRKEIPQLNNLVQEFSGKPVVFLAPSFDTAESLREFLKTTAFAYHIVPNAEAIINGPFNASSFPTHIVIDQNGLIEATLVGASERRPEEIRRLILRLLNK